MKCNFCDIPFRKSFVPALQMDQMLDHSLWIQLFLVLYSNQMLPNQKKSEHDRHSVIHFNFEEKSYVMLAIVWDRDYLDLMHSKMSKSCGVGDQVWKSTIQLLICSCIEYYNFITTIVLNYNRKLHWRWMKYISI